MVKNLKKGALNGLDANNTPFETFFFKPKKAGMNCRFSSAVDVHEIQRTSNAQELQQLIENISRGNIRANV